MTFEEETRYSIGAYLPLTPTPMDSRTANWLYSGVDFETVEEMQKWMAEIDARRPGQLKFWFWSEVTRIGRVDSFHYNEIPVRIHLKKDCQ